jgi:hypothetical protein
VTAHDDENDDGTLVAREIVRIWLVAKITPWLVRLTKWAIRLGVIAAYAGYVALRVRKKLRDGALDDDTDRPSVTVREDGVMAWVRGRDRAEP